MGTHRYKAWNGPMPTTAAQAAVATGTAIKTHLQLSTPNNRQITIIEWGYTLSAFPAGGGVVELVETDVAATVTAHVAAGVQPQGVGIPASLLTLGVANTGYTASAEGAITATRVFDVVDVTADAGAPSLKHEKVIMPEARFIIPVSRFLRVRTTMAATVNIHTWIVWEE